MDFEMRRDPTSYTIADVMEALRHVATQQSQAKLAREIGVSGAYLSEVLSGRKPVGEKIALYLGFEREVKYRKIA